MGEDRSINIKNKLGTRGCPDLYCNVILKGTQDSCVLGLSRQEANELYEKLKIYLKR